MVVCLVNLFWFDQIDVTINWSDNKCETFGFFFFFLLLQSCSNIFLFALHLDHGFTIYISDLSCIVNCSFTILYVASFSGSNLTNPWVRFQCTRNDPLITLQFSQIFNMAFKNLMVLNNSCKLHTMINDTSYKSS